MAKSIRVHSPGGPEAMRLEEDIAPSALAEGEVRIRQTAIGVNFIDVYHRTGLYKLDYPAGIGLEGAGVVEEAGKSADFKPGDRVAYCGGPTGSYAESRVMPAKFLVKIPDGVSDEVAAGSMLKGLTAHYLLCRTFELKKGQTMLLHAAAGGVGLIMTQWAKHLGATIIGAVSSDEKAALAKKAGADHVIIYTREKIAPRVREITGGEGVDVVYDSVGQATFMDSLDSLKKFGMLVSYGNASGAIPPFEPLLLAQKGSLYFTRPNLMHHIEDTKLYREYAADLFELIEKGVLSINIGGRYKLADVQKAHEDLEARRTMGSLILTP